MANQQATPSVPPRIKSLIDRREADVRSGRLAKTHKPRSTPGPWTAMVDHWNTNRRQRMAIVATPGGRMAIDCTDSGETYREDCANARLVAAAPELLRALKDLRENVEELSGFWNESTSNFIQQAEAAIAKAEGRG